MFYWQGQLLISEIMADDSHDNEILLCLSFTFNHFYHAVFFICLSSFLSHFPSLTLIFYTYYYYYYYYYFIISLFNHFVCLTHFALLVFFYVFFHHFFMVIFSLASVTAIYRVAISESMSFFFFLSLLQIGFVKKYIIKSRIGEKSYIKIAFFHCIGIFI